jgi:flagellar biosynthesis/type III secretory pathway M-ring protein FliF/YscJ
LDVVVFLLVVLLLAAVVAVVTAPLRARRAAGEEAEDDEAAGPDVAALEAARDAKYREIRDAELDYRTGKLSEADWRGLDEQLRAEAVELLRRLDRARGA